jgi:hypothetical protein
MAQVNVTPPNLPLAPAQYDQQYMDKLTNVLRLFFNQINNAGPISGATQRNGTGVISALNFVEPSTTTPNTFQVSLPTDTEYANLRVGSVYYDSATKVLKIKV